MRKGWTQEQFFSWAEAQETRYEFDGFHLVAMIGIGCIPFYGTIAKNRNTAKTVR